MLAVVVVPLVFIESPASEETLQFPETRQTLRTLRHDKPMRDLIAGPVAPSAHAVWLSHEANREATFSVYKTDDPASPDQPFLLIVRITQHVVTIVDVPSDVTR